MRILLISIFLAFSIHVSATWIPFGPEGILASNICFGISFQYQFAVCHDEGISLYESATQEWTTFSSDLPVVDAFYLDGYKLLVILNHGSKSDGIYAFDPVTSNFEVIEYVLSPNFIYYDEDLMVYYVGHRFGLFTSQDAYAWSQVEDLNNCNIVDMDTYQDHYVATQVDNLYGVWYSNDAGSTWNAPAPGSPLISNLDFDNLGKLYGIFPDESWSSGLWSSSDSGETWEVEFWSINMSCVGIDVMNSVFVGWDDNPTGTEEGIANYDPVIGNLNFMNAGLNNLIINEISVNPWMSAIALFCCTDSGAYINYNYIEVEEPINSFQEAFLKVYPNPCVSVAHLRYLIHDPSSSLGTGIGYLIFDLYGIDGRMIRRIVEGEKIPGENEIEIDMSGLPAGIYIAKVTTNSGNLLFSKKIIKR